MFVLLPGKHVQMVQLQEGGLDHPCRFERNPVHEIFIYGYNTRNSIIIDIRNKVDPFS